MKEFKAGDKVKVVSAERDTYWYASKIGNIYTLKSFDGEDWVVRETDFGVFAACDLELVEDEKETISKSLKEFIIGDMLKVITEGLGNNVPVGSVLTCINESPIPGFFLSNDKVNLFWANGHKYHFEFMGNIKDQTAKFLKENKWFIRTGSPEKSFATQTWLFEHGYGWLIGKNNVSDFNEKYLTNTSTTGELSQYIMHGNSDKTNAQEIKIEFETIVKSVKLPEVAPKLTEQQLKIIELEGIINDAKSKIEELKLIK